MTTLSYPGGGRINEKFSDTRGIHNGVECPSCHRISLPRVLPSGESICGLCNAKLPEARKLTEKNRR